VRCEKKSWAGVTQVTRIAVPGAGVGVLEGVGDVRAMTGSGIGGLRTFFLERRIASHLSPVGFLLSVLLTGALLELIRGLDCALAIGQPGCSDVAVLGASCGFPGS